MNLVPAASLPRRADRPATARRAALPTLALYLFLSACGGTQEVAEQAAADRPVDELYNAAQDLLNDGNPREAAKAFEEVDRQHPYSQWATRAQMMTSFAYYEANQYDEAITAAQRFIELHPGHKDVPYAYYLVGLSQYEQISDVGRDQEMTRKASESFAELIRRFPESDYARDARLKVDLANDHLAGKEMEIGRYYQSRRQWLAAVNRFRSVVEKHQTTTHVPEALHRLVECYLELGLPEEGQRAAAWLGHNFPGNAWYERSYALLQGKDLEPQAGSGSGSWLSRLF